MYFPTLKELPTTRKTVDVFKGYNHNLRIGDGEFYEMKNMTSDAFPVLSPRRKRGVYASPEKVTGIIAKDKLCYTDGSCFVIGDTRIDMGLNGTPKQLVSMGAYVIIMPDKKYINTMDTEDRGDIDAYFETEEATFETCNAEGEVYDIQHVSETAPEEPADGEFWLDKSGKPGVLKRYSADSGMWVSIGITYVKVSAPGIGEGFAVNDGVDISGIEANAVRELNGNRVLVGCDTDFIIVQGIVDSPAGEESPEEPTGILVERKMPLMNYLTEANNRLWGCRYGPNNDGKLVNEIYACKLGDFRNWRCFMGISTDSYYASCGTDGNFTGAITYGGYPLFFKDSYLHKVYGSVPANFQIQDIACRGVQPGCSGSLAIVNETLFYKSRGGICAYDGSLPVEVSAALGNVRYGNAAAGSCGNKYYISMADSMSRYHLFVYDTAKGIWHREDNFDAVQGNNSKSFMGWSFCCFENELYAIDAESGNIVAMLGTGGKPEEKVDWMVQTGIMGADSPDSKYISKILIRMELEFGGRVSFLVQYDSRGPWEHLGTIMGTSLRSFTIPLIPARCDHLRLRIEGEGKARIYSITRTMEQGSDIS